MYLFLFLYRAKAGFLTFLKSYEISLFLWRQCRMIAHSA
ncbi:protein of unknown function [Listeria monocytogenes R479a]|nr:hypothetical protein NT04LM_3014 [Listeria monocytogenes FSL F2-208]CDM17361.1 protein of unknown function [Listeria monocytogenes R479a]